MVCVKAQYCVNRIRLRLMVLANLFDCPKVGRAFLPANTTFVVFSASFLKNTRKNPQKLPSVEFIDSSYPVCYVQFFVNVIDMLPYCLRAEEGLGGDFFIHQAF